MQIFLFYTKVSTSTLGPSHCQQPHQCYFHNVEFEKKNKTIAIVLVLHLADVGYILAYHILHEYSLEWPLITDPGVSLSVIWQTNAVHLEVRQLKISRQIREYSC